MHDLGATERDRLLRGRIAAMPADQFEQLVFELVRRYEPTARRLSPPDDGADTLRPATDGVPAKVWQAKHYPVRINWSQCRQSLADAIERWSPSMVFVFPRDLSERQEAGFTEHLEQHPDVAASATIVSYWNQSELVARLNEHEDLKARFFGPDQEGILAVLNRTAAAGGALGTPEDLVERARTLSEWAERQDTRFMQGISSDGLEAPQPKWDELPYMVVSMADQSTRVSIAAWPREGATVQPPIFRFDGTEEGQRARRAAVERLAGGETAEVTEGGQVFIDAPELVRALAPPDSIRNPVLTLGPGEAIPLEIEISSDGTHVSRTIDLYQVPAAPEANGALAGYSGSVLIEATILLLEEPRIQLQLGLSATFGDDIPANAAAAELLAAMYGAADIVLRSDVLFPTGGEIRGPLDLGRERDEEKLLDFEIMRDAFSAIVYIRERLGIDLTPPEAFSPVDLDALLTIQDVLKTGEGTADFKKMTGMVDGPSEIAWVAERASGTNQRRPVTYDVFGQVVTLGMGEYTLPRLKVVDVIPYGQAANSPARVVMQADGDSTMVFRLL